MIYANKKVQQTTSSSVQNAEIISNVKELEEKEMVRIMGNEVYLESGLWRNQLHALNWINCLHIYCCLKLRFKEKDPLYFKDINTAEPIGAYENKKAKVFLFK